MDQSSYRGKQAKEEFTPRERGCLRLVSVLVVLTAVFFTALLLYHYRVVMCTSDADCNGFPCVANVCQCDETQPYFRCKDGGYYDPVINGLVWTTFALLITTFISCCCCFFTVERVEKET